MTTAIAPKPRILTDNQSPEHRLPSTSDWQRAMQDAISDPSELLESLGLGEEWLPGALAAAKQFPLRVPRSYVARMQKGNPHDPLLRQVLPLNEENIQTDGFVTDAVGDLASLRAGGLLQKYHGRALLITTGACAVHCRFCFRREFPYQQNMAVRNDWNECLQVLHDDKSITEVILSGGDPLSLSDNKLAELAKRLDDIPHLQRLRIHTRQPVVLPERVDQALLSWLSTGRLQRVVVLHVNHANELSGNAADAVDAIAKTGVTLLNQTVLLKGVNDTADSLVSLNESLFALGVMPYYLHMLDRVRGTAHFEVSESIAKNIMQELAARLPGYLVPKLVQEEIGKSNKTNVLW